MRTVLSLILIFWITNILAQEAPILRKSEELQPISVNLDELAWISGEWMFEDESGRMEEYWYPPLANSMMGCFRMTSKGKIKLYEFMQISNTKNSTELQIKHFSANLSGREDAAESERFELLKVEPGFAYFDGFTFQLIDQDHLDIYVVMQRGSEQEVIGEFHYIRQ